MTQTASNGNTALHWAAFHGFTDMIEVLLQTGAVLDAPGNHERSTHTLPALLCAVCQNPTSSHLASPEGSGAERC